MHPGRRRRPQRPDAPGDTFIATDSVGAAHARRYVCKATGGKGVAAVIQGQLGTTPELDRTRASPRRCPSARPESRRQTVEQHVDAGRGLTKRPGPAAANPKSRSSAGPDALALGAAQAAKVANVGHKVVLAASTATSPA